MSEPVGFTTKEVLVRIEKRLDDLLVSHIDMRHEVMERIGAVVSDVAIHKIEGHEATKIAIQSHDQRIAVLEAHQIADEERLEIEDRKAEHNFRRQGWAMAVGAVIATLVGSAWQAIATLVAGKGGAP